MPAATGANTKADSAIATVVKVVPSVFNGDVRSLPLSKPWYPGDPIVTRPPRRMEPATAPTRTASITGSGATSQALVDGTTRPPGDLPPDDVVPLAFSPPDLDIDGSAFTGAVPPDPVGDIGSQHYIQMVNGLGGSSVTIFDKSGVVQAGPFDLDDMWTGGGPCADGFGDPIVLYDAMADRWLLSEVTDPYDADPVEGLCAYVSQTSDPIAGGWLSYFFPTPDFPDYPKYAVWSDAYYVSTNESPDEALALERAAMLAGLPATMQGLPIPDLPGFSGFSPLVPSDLDGPTPPPAGSPNFFMRHRDDELHGPAIAGTDRLEIWEYHVDWATPALTTLTGPIDVRVGEFDSVFCNGLRSCLPQPLVGQDIDALREPIMFRLQYRNFGDHESLVGNLVTDVDPAAGSANIHAAVRWFELRRGRTGQWYRFQEGTVAPDADNRWLGSIAMDGCGNIALGHSVASTTTFPGINYIGRLVSDPPGTMPVGEATLIAGTGSQQTDRWGDYSAMVVDEVDQCTFWYTNEYLPNTPSTTNANWRTRIGSFRFPSCGLPSSPGDEVPNTSLRVIKETSNPTAALRLDWLPVTNATTYNVYRGDIDSLFVGRVYNHAASPGAGAGFCDLTNSFFVDPDDQNDSTDFYYLVTAQSCLVEGTTGFDSFGLERPAGSGCP